MGKRSGRGGGGCGTNAQPIAFYTVVLAEVIRTTAGPRDRGVPAAQLRFPHRSSMSFLSALLSAAILAASAPDSTTRVHPGGPVAVPLALTRAAAEDTVKRKAKAVSYGDGYAKRLSVHRALSWAMLPLFAASYVSGDQLLTKGTGAPEWAESVHPFAAGGTALLFGANAVTGTWNLWEGRRDPNGRTRRVVHSVLFLAASGGFAYTGSIADEAKENGDRRRLHRTVALGSMSLSTASWLLMLVGN